MCHNMVGLLLHSEYCQLRILVYYVLLLPCGYIYIYKNYCLLPEMYYLPCNSQKSTKMTVIFVIMFWTSFWCGFFWNRLVWLCVWKTCYSNVLLQLILSPKVGSTAENPAADQSDSGYKRHCWTTVTTLVFSILSKSNNGSINIHVDTMLRLIIYKRWFWKISRSKRWHSLVLLTS